MKKLLIIIGLAIGASCMAYWHRTTPENVEIDTIPWGVGEQPDTVE